jgi:hypothetical protein
MEIRCAAYPFRIFLICLLAANICVVYVGWFMLGVQYDFPFAEICVDH